MPVAVELIVPLLITPPVKVVVPPVNNDVGAIEMPSLCEVIVQLLVIPPRKVETSAWMP